MRTGLVNFRAGIRTSTGVLLLIVCCGVGCAPPAQPAPPLSDGSGGESAWDMSADPRFDPSSPAGALRCFYVAITESDREGLRRYATSIEDSEIDLIVDTQELFPTGEFDIRQMLANTRVRELKPGDKWSVPGGKRVQTVTKEQATGNRRMMQMEGI